MTNAVVSAITLGSMGSNLVSDVGASAGEGLLVFAALFGIGVVIRAFVSAAS